LIALGAQNLYFDINFTTSAVNQRNCVHYNRADIVKSNEYPLFNKFQAHLIEVAAFLGCDYVKRGNGFGPATVLKGSRGRPAILESYLDANDKALFLRGIVQHDPIAYVAAFNQACNLFRHAPFYDKASKTLKPLTNTADGASWHDLIGFDPHELLLPLSNNDYSKASLFDSCSFQTGLELQSITPPVYTGMANDNPEVEAGTILPRFARLDFERLPISCVPGIVLDCWAATRGVIFRKDDSREQKEQDTKSMIANGIFILEPQYCSKDMNWLGFEALEVEPERSFWSVQYFSELNLLPLITDRDDLDRFYKNGDEQNRFRGITLVDGGNIITSSISFIKTRVVQSNAARALHGDRPMVLFRCMCAPSQKSDKLVSANIDTKANKEYYTVYLCFEAGGRVQGFPFSCCGCPKGRTFCSHLVAFLTVCAIAQREPNGQQVFEATMPMSPYELQRKPILVENLCRRDPYYRSQEAKDQQKNRRQSFGIASPIKKLRRSPDK
jgi:hypothetical protein